MKLVPFSVPGPCGSQQRHGVLADAGIVDLTTAYAGYVAHATDEPLPGWLPPLPGEWAQLRVPPNRARPLNRRWPGWRGRTCLRMRAASTMHGSFSTAQRSSYSQLPRPNSFRGAHDPA